MVIFRSHGPCGCKAAITSANDGLLVDVGFNGFGEGFDITSDDEYSLYNLEFTFPEMRIGKLTVGRMKAPATISRVSGGAYLPTAFRQAPVSALTKSRDDGVRLTNTAFDSNLQVCKLDH